MKPKTASKWIIGVSSVALSTFFFSQIHDDNQESWNKPTTLQQEISSEDYIQSSNYQEENNDLDWKEFDTTTTTKETEDEQRNTNSSTATAKEEIEDEQRNTDSPTIITKETEDEQRRTDARSRRS